MDNCKVAVDTVNFAGVSARLTIGARENADVAWVGGEAFFSKLRLKDLLN